MKQTSIEAHNSMKPVKPIHHAIILETMLRIGKPATSEQISIQCRLNYYQVARRLSEMEKDGKVRATEYKAMTASGRMAVKWEVVTNQLDLFKLDN